MEPVLEARLEAWDSCLDAYDGDVCFCRAQLREVGAMASYVCPCQHMARQSLTMRGPHHRSYCPGMKQLDWGYYSNASACDYTVCTLNQHGPCQPQSQWH